MLEKQVEARLNKRVKDLGGLTFKWISTVTGVPDRIVILNSKVFFVELKTPKGVLSARQKVVFAQIGQQGHQVHVLRSYDDIEDFIAAAS